MDERDPAEKNISDTRDQEEGNPLEKEVEIEHGQEVREAEGGSTWGSGTGPSTRVRNTLHR